MTDNELKTTLTDRLVVGATQFLIMSAVILVPTAAVNGIRKLISKAPQEISYLPKTAQYIAGGIGAFVGLFHFIKLDRAKEADQLKRMQDAVDSISKHGPVDLGAQIVSASKEIARISADDRKFDVAREIKTLAEKATMEKSHYFEEKLAADREFQKEHTR